MKVRLTFIEEVLGSAPTDKEIYATYIASKGPDAKTKEEEIEAIGEDEFLEKTMTVFPRTKDGRPMMWDYQVKGMFKNAGKAMGYVGGKSKLTAYKSKIDNLVFINERKIPYILPKNGVIGNCQRPLRASTAQGERIALANSESIPALTTVTFTIKVLADEMMEHVKRWLDYGELNGLGQWHNSGKGRFLWEELDKEGEVIGGNYDEDIIQSLDM